MCATEIAERIDHRGGDQRRCGSLDCAIDLARLEHSDHLYSGRDERCEVRSHELSEQLARNRYLSEVLRSSTGSLLTEKVCSCGGTQTIRTQRIRVRD